MEGGPRAMTTGVTGWAALDGWLFGAGPPSPAIIGLRPPWRREDTGTPTVTVTTVTGFDHRVCHQAASGDVAARRPATTMARPLVYGLMAGPTASKLWLLN